MKLCDFCSRRIQKNIPITISDQCQLCKGRLHKFVSQLENLNKELNEIEFHSYTVSINLSSDIKRVEDRMRRRGIIFSTLKLMIKQLVDEMLITQNKQKILKNPEITIIIRDVEPLFAYEIKSIYIVAKYMKFSRNIPQTKWPCSNCNGSGCSTCDFSGLQYKLSVEGIIADPFLKQSKALSSSFHGAGREDIDARMLGSGRPFVLELKQPRIRSIDLKVAQEMVNKSKTVNIIDPKICKKKLIAQLKSESSKSSKIYQAIVMCSGQITQDLIKRINALQFPIHLDQQTPKRVLHRRADIIREKLIERISIVDHNPKHLILEIQAQGGAYIKEFISGDDGRTNPSLTSILQNNCYCAELDVIHVDDKGLF